MTTPAAPWPLPRLALAAEVETAPSGRNVTAFHVTHAKQAGEALLDPGDGGEVLHVPLTAAEGDAGPYEGTAVHTYTDPGHHTYTATATAPCPVRFGTWEALPAAADTWSAISAGTLDTWADADRDQEVTTTQVTVDVGPATIWATLATVPGSPLPIVHLDTWIGDPDSVARWTVSRECPAPADFQVDIWTGTSQKVDLALEDHEAPLGVPVRYRLTLLLRDGTRIVVHSNTVTLGGTRGCFLTDTGTGRTIAVEVQSWGTREWEARQAVLEVINRPDPVVLSDVHTRAKGEWVLLTRDREALLKLYQVLLASRMVLLRTQPTSSLQAVYAAVGNVSEARLYPGLGEAWERLTTCAVQEVAPIPATARLTSTEWTHVAARFERWEELPERFPAWIDVGQWIPRTPLEAA